MELGCKDGDTELQDAHLLTRSLLRPTTLSSLRGKRGKENNKNRNSLPSLWLAIERVGQRSVVGVSKLGGIQSFTLTEVQTSYNLFLSAAVNF